MATTRGMEGKIFFIYDHSYLKKEADDLKDAIVYFSPQTVDIDTQCALCGQLMGMVGFFRAMTSSAPNCFTLHRNKFAVRHYGRYTAALSGDPCEPDSVLHRQLTKLYNTFCFYHGNLHHMYESCNGERVQFLGRIIHIWDYLLPACRYYGDTFSASFDYIPTVELPKSGASVYLKATHLLQLSQEKPGVMAGCLIFKNRVLSSQLPPDITAKLLMLKGHGQDTHDMHFPCQQLTPDFSLPKGVRIVCVYLTPQEYLPLYASNRSQWSKEAPQPVPKPATRSGQVSSHDVSTPDSGGTASSPTSSSQHNSLRVDSEGDTVSSSSSYNESKLSSSTVVIHSGEYERISNKKSSPLLNSGKSGTLPAVSEAEMPRSSVTSEESDRSGASSQEKSTTGTGQDSGELLDSQNSMLDVRWADDDVTHINKTPISTPQPGDCPEHSSEISTPQPGNCPEHHSQSSSSGVTNEASCVNVSTNSGLNVCDVNTSSSVSQEIYSKKKKVPTATLR